MKLTKPGYQGFSSRRGHGSSLFYWISRPTLNPLQHRIQRSPGCEADQAPASHAEVGNKWSCTFSPYAFTSCTALPLLSYKLFQCITNCVKCRCHDTWSRCHTWHWCQWCAIRSLENEPVALCHRLSWTRHKSQRAAFRKQEANLGKLRYSPLSRFTLNLPT